MYRRDPDRHRRCRQLRDGRKGGGPVVYWMSREQRADDNWALLWAQEEARARQRPLLVVFCLVPDYPGANPVHYRFLLDGLQETADRLSDLNIGFQLLPGPPVATLPPLLAACDAQTLVTDFDPLRLKRQWKTSLIDELRLPIYEVDSHNIVPVWIASPKREYGAYTLRPKIDKLLDLYLTEPPPPIRHPYGQADPGRAELTTVGMRLLGELPTPLLPGGERAARRAMQEAIDKRLPGYATRASDPCREGQSGLSPYLHFGQLSPQRLAFDVKQSSLADEDKAAFLEELIIRRELADNYCWYEPDYDQFVAFPDWARKTLDDHRHDRREAVYTLSQFEQAATHERLWNACQRDLVRNGRLHGYLRMYWAKKILEWSASPEEAMAIAIRLNDRYSLDGRDPNGYTGIAWSIGGVHDRAWRERKVFGKIRYMNENGCRRKFDVDGYIRKVEGGS